MYIELTQGGNSQYNSKPTKRLLPLGSFEVIECENGEAIILPTACNSSPSWEEMNWRPNETYQQIRSMIAMSGSCSVVVVSR